MRALLKQLFAPTVNPAHGAYIALVERARNGFFYDRLGVPDTLDGRFELIVLHLFLLQHRLRTDAPEFARNLSETFFADMDRSVRELGVSDTGVRYRIKAMAKAYHGRLQAYTAAVDDPAALRAALARNLYGTVEDGSVALLDDAANYLLRTQTALAGMKVAEITSHSFVWPAL